MKRHPFRRSATRGIVAVEFAFVLIPLVLLATGVAEFGRAIYQYDALTKGVRDAARYLSVYYPYVDSNPPFTTTQATTYNQQIQDAKCLVVYGSTTCGASGTELVSGLSTSMVYVCDANHTTDCNGSDATDPTQFASVTTYDSSGNPAGSINLVEVKIKGYTYQPIPAFPGIAAFNFSNIITVMRQAT